MRMGGLLGICRETLEVVWHVKPRRHDVMFVFTLVAFIKTWTQDELL
jgi:hypothetical protein